MLFLTIGFIVHLTTMDLTTLSLKFSSGNDADCLSDISVPCKTFAGLFEILDSESKVEIFPENVKDEQLPSSHENDGVDIYFRQNSDESFIFSTQDEIRPLLSFNKIHRVSFKNC